MAGSGKVKGLTRPGSKIVLVSDEPVQGESLVGSRVQKRTIGRDGFVDGEVEEDKDTDASGKQHVEVRRVCQ